MSLIDFGSSLLNNSVCLEGRHDNLHYLHNYTNDLNDTRVTVHQKKRQRHGLIWKLGHHKSVLKSPLRGQEVCIQLWNYLTRIQLWNYLTLIQLWNYLLKLSHTGSRILTTFLWKSHHINLWFTATRNCVSVNKHLSHVQLLETMTEIFQELRSHRTSIRRSVNELWYTRLRHTTRVFAPSTVIKSRN